MLFTADGRGTPGSRSAIWSAVSTDRTHWQVEGEVLGGQGVDLYYSAMVGDLVITVRKGADGRAALAMATLLMP